MKIIQITATTQPMLNEWDAKARLDPTVWPYMSFDPLWSPFKAEDGDDWSDAYFMDDGGQALLHYDVDRRKSAREATVNLWVLQSKLRPMIAGRMMARLPQICRRYGCVWLSASCHESNAASQKLLRRVFRIVPQVKEEFAWNGHLGRYEDVLVFRRRVSEIF